jgi:hypothetical protein
VSLPFLKAVAGGVELSVRVQPRASRSRLAGEHGGALKVQLAAPPVEGEANEALVELFARLLKVPRRQVELISGHASRSKRLRISGLDSASVEAAMKEED